jgi:ADP-ribose pyrophosphatase YjhB (NUDIX family)
MREGRRYCSKCSGEIERRRLDQLDRDVCGVCGTIFYDNPLPVVSAVVVVDRQVLLVLRGREPKAGMWCLPSGFVELDETIEQAVLRETEEESGVRGEVVRLLDTGSHANEMYGDLIWVTFEVRMTGGAVRPGDDASDARFFPIDALPELAFPSNRLAVERYLDHYRDIWAMQDSFSLMDRGGGGMLSDTLFEIISADADVITRSWLDDVTTSPSTQKYGRGARERMYRDAHFVVSQFGKWISDRGADERMREHFRKMGADAKRAGLPLSEIISALSLTRKHIFARAFARTEAMGRPIEQYRILEMTTRVNLFYDKAVYDLAKGYEGAD